MIKKILLIDYFDIHSTLQDDKINFEISSKEIQNSYPFIGRSSNNNGVAAYVTGKESLINQGNVITIALDGSTGSTFYQHHDFCSGQNIWKLIPINEKFENFDSVIAMYCITSIRKAVKNYSYNLSLTKTRLSNIKIILPLHDNGCVDIKIISQIMENIRNIEIVRSVSNKRI